MCNALAKLKRKRECKRKGESVSYGKIILGKTTRRAWETKKETKRREYKAKKKEMRETACSFSLPFCVGHWSQKMRVRVTVLQVMHFCGWKSTFFVNGEEKVVRGVEGCEKNSPHACVASNSIQKRCSKICCDIDGYFWGRGRSVGVFHGSFYLSLVPLATP